MLVLALHVKPFTDKVNDVGLLVAEEAQLQNQEESNWGPKTSDPRPDQIYPSDRLRETINVDPELESLQ